LLLLGWGEDSIAVTAKDQGWAADGSEARREVAIEKPSKGSFPDPRRHLPAFRYDPL
jgi:hypothetical protein